MQVILEMFLKLFVDKHMKDHVKSTRSLWKIIENHPSTTSLKFSSLKLNNLKSIVNL
jgi:hypothetical protein